MTPSLLAHQEAGSIDGLTAQRDDTVDVLTQPANAADPGGSRQQVFRFVWPTHGVFAGWGSYGIYVEIDHGNGFHSIYGHMSAVLVKTGDNVTQGQLLGLMGATGRATGVHLHFEIRYQGVPQNPIDLLP
ncbi:MAG: M23 family metallopeptidase [Chloroflexota bacterium]|nr:MAG: M23 family metallopeptidase [Chloroflexota bacterium]